MKLLVVSDIHADWPALRAVHEAESDADRILCLGDLVNFGPQPAEFVAWPKEKIPPEWVVQGNHDRAVAFSDDPHCSPLHALAAVMALAIIFLPLTTLTLGTIFILGGIYVAMEETLEDSFCAELMGEEQPGMAIGTPAPVNGVGDLLSCLVGDPLWTAFGSQVAFD